MAQLRCALVRRMGEGARAARGRVWGPRPVALARMRLAKRASMRKGCEGSGVGDNIRVVTERGLKTFAATDSSPAAVFSLKTLVLSRAPCPGSSFYVCSAALFCGLPVHDGKGPAALKVRCITIFYNSKRHNLARYCLI
jgi:hypothetical protein